MQKFQVGLIAVLICCVALVSCNTERAQQMMAPAGPTEEPVQDDMGSAEPAEEPVQVDTGSAEPIEEPVQVDTGPGMMESPTDTEPSEMPGIDVGGGDSDVTGGMVLIPAGEFQMGSIDADADSDEKPVHTVYVDAFYMDTHEVTNAAYKAFVDANPQWQKGNIQAKFHDGEYLRDWDGNNYPAGKANHPVTWVSWYAAVAYAAWAEKRLPTEAEWEYAARGGLKGKKYPWGDTISPQDANYFPHASGATAVGRYAANNYGLFDMAGNMWEWCLDEWVFDFYANSPNRNPLSGAPTIRSIQENFASVESDRVLRGGSWNSKARSVRVASREFYAPQVTGSVLGFRCVRAVTP